MINTNSLTQNTNRFRHATLPVNILDSDRGGKIVLVRCFPSAQLSNEIQFGQSFREVFIRLVTSAVNFSK
jgi:hypothetical protein